MAASVNLTQELKNLQDKKNTLEQAIKIASSLEKLNQGLKAVILMGKPASGISKKSLENIEELDDKTKILSSFKLKEILARLEKTVHKKLTLIIEIAGMDEKLDAEDNGAADLSQEEIDIILHEYLKSAQTAVALKVILRARGEVTRPTVLSLPSGVIKEQLAAVDAREKDCRLKVKAEMHDLIVDTEVVLSREDLPDELREIIEITRVSLEMNLQHIKEGKNINDMPVTIESIEIGSDKSRRVQSKTKGQKNKIEKIKKIYYKKTHKKPQSGFFQKLWRWVTTPPSVGWNDIDVDTRDEDD
ncbi:MAG: hypothetical protein GXP13_07350 [Gammaproteobacteria bacterium]|nr:hypothetical protein [Gammaproteobacteria bacterium]